MCICDQLLPLMTRTKLVVWMHAQEVVKPTNTGRLACQCLQNSELRLFGQKDGADARPLYAPNTTPALLFPSANARCLDTLRDGPPVTLIVPDGTWRQAMRLRRRIAVQGPIPFVRLPEGPSSQYRLRTGQKPEHLSTLEAIARALGILEGREVQAHLERVQTIFTERVLWLRGELHEDQVTGGIPAGATR